MEMFILFWFPLSIAVGVYASNKGRSGFGLFLLSVFLSPIVGLLFALALRNKAADHAELLEALRKATPPLPAQSISTPEPAVKLFTLKDDTSPVNRTDGIPRGGSSPWQSSRPSLPCSLSSPRRVPSSGSRSGRLPPGTSRRATKSSASRSASHRRAPSRAR